MRAFVVPVVLFAAATLSGSASAKADAYYCYWVDAPAKQAGVTAIFLRLSASTCAGVRWPAPFRLTRSR